jgi:hypothetical protein
VAARAAPPGGAALTVGGRRVEAVGQRLHVLVPVQVVEGVLEREDVHVGQQQRVAQHQELLCGQGLKI